MISFFISRSLQRPMMCTFKLMLKKSHCFLSNSVIFVCGYHTESSEKICIVVVIPHNNIPYNITINHYFIDNAISYRAFHAFICTSIPRAFSVFDVIIIKCLILDFY